MSLDKSSAIALRQSIASVFNLRQIYEFDRTSGLWNLYRFVESEKACSSLNILCRCGNEREKGRECVGIFNCLQHGAEDNSKSTPFKRFILWTRFGKGHSANGQAEKCRKSVGIC